MSNGENRLSCILQEAKHESTIGWRDWDKDYPDYGYPDTHTDTWRDSH